ncbi:MAG: cytochrome c oxidase assembly protein [Nocardioidaceae bacterium]
MSGPVVPLHAGEAAGLGSAGWALVAVVGGVSVLLLACYARGVVRMRTHPQGRRRQRAWRPAAMAAGVVSLLVVTLPPLGELLEQRLATHMVQHIVMIMVSAPLFALATPGQPLLAGMPAAVRRPLVRLGHRLPGAVLLAPGVAWVLHIAALWAWHMPAAYDLALDSELVHLCEHACFLLTAWVFWWHLATVAQRRLRGPAALLYVVAAVPPGAALGAMLTFPEHPLYPAQAAHAAASGINPMLDQRIGGLVMWIPLDLVYLAIAVLLMGRWFKSMDARWRPSLATDLPRDAVRVAEPEGVAR